MTKYLITFSSGAPDWSNDSKYQITAESRSQALHFANLMHDDVYGYDIAMITISKLGKTEVNPSLFVDLDEIADRVKTLNRIWERQKSKYKDVDF